MNEPKTPNLGLNKIDRSSPSTTYFDLDKYLDQNWEKVDGFAEQLEEKVEESAAQVSGIQERLDTEKRRSVTLEPGLQIINAERASPFKLEGLKGRTLVNLLGRDGGCENTSNWFTTAGIMAELDRSHKTQGSQSIKILLKEGSTGGSLYKQLGQSLSNNKNYLAIADLKRGTASSVSLSLWNGSANVLGTVVTADIFSGAILLIPASGLGTVTNNLQISVVGSELGQFGHVDAVRLYEITGEELTSLSTMSANEITAKYPYVDSIQPVSNPYVIRYGENLLPPFYEWEHTGHTFLETSQNTAIGELVAGSIGTDAYAVTYLSVLANQEYTISNPAESTGKIRVSIYDKYTRLQGMFINPGETKTIRTALTAVRMGMNLSGVTQYTDEFEVSKWTWTVGNRFSFKSPIMTLGKSGILFKPRENVMLALQTDLYADPVNGTNADEVFERDGQYFKLKKWQKVILDGSQVFSYSPTSSGISFKAVYTDGLSNAVGRSGEVIKFDGRLLSKIATLGSADSQNGIVENPGRLFILISSKDSGWGDDYVPTADEIRAYFMGWRMSVLSEPRLTVYNGTGTKVWIRTTRMSDAIVLTGNVDYTTTLPTNFAGTDSLGNGYTPYQLVYQLVRPIIEPIMSEGQLTFNEGENQIEVGSGMVIREKAAPVFTSNEYKSYNINNYNISSKLSNKVKKIIAVYKNNIRDDWEILKFQPESSVYGLELASLPASQYDPSAYYTVTYQMLDLFPLVSISGTVNNSEKSILNKLINDSGYISTRLSAMESKGNENEFQKYTDKYFLRKSSSINENEDLNNFVYEGEFYCQFNTTVETLKNCPVGLAFSLKVSKNGTKNKDIVPGVTQTLVTFLPVGFTTWQRNFYDVWGAWIQVPSREEFESLKSSVSDGKSAIAAAITGKGVTASGSDTFSQMVAKIGQINTGKKFASGSIPALGEGNYRDFQIGFTPNFGIAHADPYNPTDSSFFAYSNVNGGFFRIEPIPGGVRVKPGTNRGSSRGFFYAFE